MKLRELYETIQLDENYKGNVGKIKNEVPTGAPGYWEMMTWDDDDEQ